MMRKEKPILLVEDNPDDADLALRTFKKNKIQNDAIGAQDGVESLDYLFGTGTCAGRSAEELPAVGLLDRKLPRVGGLEVLRQRRSNPRTRLLPVVILTSSREERGLSDGYLLSANSYIRKPVDFAQFAESVRRLGQYRLVLNEAPPTNT